MMHQQTYAPWTKERDYSALSARGDHDPQQNLWKVKDNFVGHPEERFAVAQSPFLEAVSEQGFGPLEASPTPKGLLAFMEDIAEKFSAVPSKFVGAGDVAWQVMRFLDYTEPYYLLVDCPVQLSIGAQLVNTYRHKKSNSVLPPDKIEIFKVNSGYDFKQFRTAADFLAHPGTVAVLSGQYVKHTGRGDRITRRDLVSTLSEILWGNLEFLESWVEEWMYGFYSDLEYDHNLGDDDMLNMRATREQDKPYWYAAAIGALMWFKSPYAVRFLVENHPIYQSLLEWNKQDGRPEVIPSSGGIAIVEGWDILTLGDVYVESGVLAGSCTVCKQSLHCTKLVNSWAVVDPICDCGKPIKIELQDSNEVYYEYTHKTPECRTYADRHPGYPRVDYVCLHCLFNKMNKLPQETRCGRTTCPNTMCVHHMGQHAYVRGLTKNRTMMLTQHKPQ